MPLDRLTSEEASALLQRYPAFTYAALRILRTTTDPAARDKMRQRLAATIGSTSDIRELLGADSESLAGFYPDTVTPHPTTDKTIEQFIDRFGTQDAPLQYTPGESIQENSRDNSRENIQETEQPKTATNKPGIPPGWRTASPGPTSPGPPSAAGRRRRSPCRTAPAATGPAGRRTCSPSGISSVPVPYRPSSPLSISSHDITCSQYNIVTRYCQQKSVAGNRFQF